MKGNKLLRKLKKKIVKFDRGNGKRTINNKNINKGWFRP